jgi:sortase B
MKNGTMFHDLRSYVDATFLEEHPYIYIYMPDRVLKYEIFATYQTDNRHLLYAYDYSTKSGRQQYLKEVLEQRNMTALFNDNASVDSNSKIITLSTCVHATGPDRYLVQAVLIEEYQPMLVSAD